MKNLKVTGPHTLLQGYSPEYEILLNLGIYVTKRDVKFYTELNVPKVATFTVGFDGAAAKALFEGVEAVVDSTSITVNATDDVNGNKTITCTYNPASIEEVAGNIYLLINSDLLVGRAYAIPIDLKSWGWGTLSYSETLNFPTVNVGDTISLPLTLTNASAVAPVFLTAFELNSTVGMDFVIDVGMFPITLNPLASIDLPILFHPTHNSLRSATLKFLRDTTYLPNVELALLGNGSIGGVTETTPVVTFHDPQIQLPYVAEGLIGRGLFYQVLENKDTQVFVVTSYIFNGIDSQLVYPDLIVGTVISVGEKITIPIRYDMATPGNIPRVTLDGFYI